MAKRKLVKCEIRWGKWMWFFNDPLTKARMTSGAYTKAEFVRQIVEILRARVIPDPTLGYSLRIYKRNGQIQEERTYGPDPRRSKG